MGWEYYPDWFKRRRKRSPFWLFGDIDEIMKEMEEMMQKEFKEFQTRVPKDLVRERKLPDGTKIREMGPFVYGYSMTVGPDGKPKIREFGNVKPTLKPEAFGISKPSLSVKEEREPLVDVLTKDNEIQIIAELPGVEKNDITLHGTEDNLTIITPMQTYTLPSGALKKFSRDQISKEMQNIIRKDVQIGSANYRSAFRDLKRLVQSISGSGRGVDQLEESSADSAASMEFLLPRYRETLMNMERLRVVDEKWFLTLAQQMKMIGGQKNVFFFYQREFRPEISGTAYNRIISEYQDKPNVLAEINDLFAFYRRDTELNPNRIKQAFADSSIDFYFLFMDRRPESAPGIIMKEQSEDVFSTFSEVTKATGGLIRTSQNPAMGFKNAVTASESCYFLFYSPKDYKKDGKFKKIEVKMKNRDYNIKYRTGYIAD